MILPVLKDTSRLRFAVFLRLYRRKRTVKENHKFWEMLLTDDPIPLESMLIMNKLTVCFMMCMQKKREKPFWSLFFWYLWIEDGVSWQRRPRFFIWTGGLTFEKLCGNNNVLLEKENGNEQQPNHHWLDQSDNRDDHSDVYVYAHVYVFDHAF